MINLQDIIDSWNSFFFDPNYSSLSLGAFRIVLGLLCFLNFLLQVKDGRKYFGVDGFFNVKDFLNTNFYKNRFSLFRYLPYVNGSVYFLLFFMMVASLCLCVGFYSRLSSLIVFLGLISLGHRNAAVCSSGDAILRIFTFLMIFSRAGNVLSLDAYLSGSSLINDSGAPWVQRLMQIQVSIIYFYSMIVKLNNSELWKNGTASYYVMQNRAHTAEILPKFFLSQPFVQLATYGTLIIEFMTSTLIWIKEFRPYCIVAGLCLHMGLELCIRIQLFGYSMMALLVLFMSPEYLGSCLKSLGIN